MPLRARGALLVAVAVLAGACAILGQRAEPGAEVPLQFGYENHSAVTYTLRWQDDGGGFTTARIGACESGSHGGVAIAPFEVVLGPGDPERNEAQPLPRLFDSNGLPPAGRSGYRLTIGPDGSIELAPNDGPPMGARDLC